MRLKVEFVSLAPRFIGDFEKEVKWSGLNLKSCRKFLDRLWNSTEFIDKDHIPSVEFNNLLNSTIKKVTEDIEQMKFNTAVSSMMILMNEIYKLRKINRGSFRKFLILLNPNKLAKFFISF